jgi:hypothetical protein
MGQSQHATGSTADGRSVTSRVFGVVSRRETYENIAYLLARFPLGVAYFAVFVAGLSLGAGLIPVVVGIPILAGVIGLGGYVGVIEAALLSRLYGQNISYDVADPGELPLIDYLKTVATTPRNYLLVLFAFGSFAVGLSLFIFITVAFALALALAVAPLTYWMPGVEYTLGEEIGTVDVGPILIETGSSTGIVVDTLPEALAVSVFGIVTALVAMHLVNLIAWVLRTLTGRLLGATPE